MIFFSLYVSRIRGFVVGAGAASFSRREARAGAGAHQNDAAPHNMPKVQKNNKKYTEWCME
jgi:hypothetical protein